MKVAHNADAGDRMDLESTELALAAVGAKALGLSSVARATRASGRKIGVPEGNEG